MEMIILLLENSCRIIEKARKYKTKRKNKKKLAIVYPFFKEHKDTAQLAYNMNAFKPGDTIYITRKMHGTSARTAKTVKVEDKNSFVRTLLRMKPKKEKNIAMRGISIDSNDGLFQGHITVLVDDLSALNALMKKLKTVKGVKSVDRVTLS